MFGVAVDVCESRFNADLIAGIGGVKAHLLHFTTITAAVTDIVTTTCVIFNFYMPQDFVDLPSRAKVEMGSTSVDAQPLFAGQKHSSISRHFEAVPSN